MGLGTDGLGRWEYRVLVSEHNEKCHKMDDPETSECGFTPEISSNRLRRIPPSN